MSSLSADLLALFARQRFGIKPGLAITRNLLKNLDLPQNRFPAIHIAGTNGKGSVASLVAAILTAAGYRTGLYTSPHLVDFGERFQINGTPAGKEELAALFRRVERADTGERPATFFEFATAMAFTHFAENHVDIAVIETGMGGLWDATSLCSPLATVITTISLEHQQYLGDTLASIATEKAGIIKPRIPMVTGVRDADAIGVIRDTAKEAGAPLFEIGRDFSLTSAPPYLYKGILGVLEGIQPTLSGGHQETNTAMALATIEILCNHNPEFRVPEPAVRKGLSRHFWPGRIQMLCSAPRILLDGAHNPEAATALADYLENETPSPRTFVIGVLEDKDIAALLSPLLPLADQVIFTRPETARATDPHKIARFLPPALPVTIEPDPVSALHQAMATTPLDGTICIAGSLYLAGEVLTALSEKRISLPA